MINLANEVFGFNGWSSTIREVQIDFVDKDPTTGKISLGLSVIVRVTLRDGAHHEDIGYGQIENVKSKAAAFEKAKKEGATDALKRALRNFGNVLGNCLYDKDYLTRINKMKVTPRKWDEKNLHRHHAYVQVKQESSLEGSSGSTISEAPKVPALRPNTAMSNSSTGEFEDEFGGNLFDDVDFGHPDEVVLHDTEIREDTPAPQAGAASSSGIIQGQARLSAQRTQSATAQRPPGQMPPPQGQQHSHQQAQPPPPRGNPQTPIQTPIMRPNPQVLPPQQPPNNMQRPQQSNPQQGQQRPLPIYPSGHGATNSTNHPHNTIQQQNEPPKHTPPQLNPSSGSESQPRFVACRAIEIMGQSDIDPAKLPSFNPKAISPSLRRTEGVDHTSSGKVFRQSITGVPGTTTYVPASNGVPPTERRNFVNPAADVNRRIGMPGGAQSPYRGQYRPPGPPPQQAVGKRTAEAAGVGRVPLGDVSNMKHENTGSGELEEKRVKVA